MFLLTYSTLCFEEIRVGYLQKTWTDFASARRPSQVLSTVDRRPLPVYDTERPV